MLPEPLEVHHIDEPVKSGVMAGRGQSWPV